MSREVNRESPAQVLLFAKQLVLNDLQLRRLLRATRLRGWSRAEIFAALDALRDKAIAVAEQVKRDGTVDQVALDDLIATAKHFRIEIDRRAAAPTN